MTTQTAINDRITELAPRLIAYSHFIQSPELDTEDIQQEMVLALLEKGQSDPAFVEQKDAYLVRFATWEAKHAAEKTYTYNHHVQEETPLFETLPAENGDPARIAEDNELYDEMLEAIAEMSAENVTVIKMTYLGYSNLEIADAIGISAPAVSQRKNNIIRHLKQTIQE